LIFVGPQDQIYLFGANLNQPLKRGEKRVSHLSKITFNHAKKENEED
jgi:hypothetical protein